MRISFVSAWTAVGSPPITPGDGSVLVRDDENVLVELVRLAVERREPFSRSRPPHLDHTALEPSVVERVEGLAHLHHDVVRNVDDIVDALHSDGLEALHQPRRRRTHAEAAHTLSDVSSAVTRVFDLDLEIQFVR